jgi:hypothetical protein
MLCRYWSLTLFEFAERLEGDVEAEVLVAWEVVIDGSDLQYLHLAHFAFCVLIELLNWP